MGTSIADKPTLLLVDDSARNLLAMEALLERLPVRIITALSASEGLALIAESTPNSVALVVTDVKMPDIDGFEFLTRIKSNPRTSGIPVLFYSGYGYESDEARRAYELGAIDFVVKPLDPDVLRAKIRMLLRLFDQEKRLAAQDEVIAALTNAERAGIVGAFDSAPVAVAILRGEEHRVAYANDHYAELTGRKQDDLAGRTIRSLYTEDGFSPFIEVLDQVFRTGQAFRDKAFRVQWKGTPGGPLVEAFLDWRCLPVSDAGAVVGTVQFFFDVTAEVQAQQALDAAQGQLQAALLRETQARHEAESANKAKDNFLAMLGHELRNPLGPIVTALQVLRLKGFAQPETAIMERQAKHLVRLVDDLLDVARIAKGKLALRMSNIEMAQVVSRCAEMVAPLLTDRQQTLTINCPADGLGVTGDPERLAQVVSNLIGNASKYSPRRSEIKLVAARRGGEVTLGVRDSGSGIAPEMMNKIFETFVQEEQPMDRPAGGLGLGLSIVRSIVLMHGGTVKAQSEGLGKGSEFIVSLPASGPSAAASSGTFATLGRPEGSPTRDQTRVLVVDDDEDTTHVMESLLRQMGLVVAVAHNAPTALSIARYFQPQVALLDLGLPIMDGYELAGLLRGIAGCDDVKLIAITGYGQPQDQQKSLNAGFAAHLTKPVDMGVLSKLILADGG